MKTTYKNIPLLKKGYPALFWIAMQPESPDQLCTPPTFAKQLAKPADRVIIQLSEMDKIQGS